MKNVIVELLKDRVAGRAISAKPLSEQIRADLAQAARLTPSCFNNQPWRFVFFESDKSRADASEAFAPANRAWASVAPLIIVGYSRAKNDCQIKDGRDYHQFDLGMAVMNILLAATDHGLAARPMAGFRPALISELLGLDEADKPLVMIAVGHPDTDESNVPDMHKGKTAGGRERKPVDEIISRQ
jgi:nitroreductase